MDRKHRHKNKNGNRPAPQQVKSEEHIKFEDVEVPQINEPQPVCSICGEPIKAIIEAISEKGGSFSHFDCVLKKLTEEYRVEEPSKISYIGHGTFAVVTPDNKGNYTIGDRFQYESNDSFASMKKYVEDQKV